MRLAATAASVCATLAVCAPSAQARGHHRHHRHGHPTTRIDRIVPSARHGSDAAGPFVAAGTESAGRIAAFDEGVLTLTLDDGSTVRGKVSADTEIRCESPDATARMAEDGASGGGDEGEQGDDRGEVESRDTGEAGESGDDDAEGEDGSCDATSLKSGVEVREAELRISPAGAVFREIELIG